jgi:membrane associated rhomboid family serine protease
MDQAAGQRQLAPANRDWPLGARWVIVSDSAFASITGQRRRSMGIYDRDYYREDSGPSILGNWSAVTILIVINVAVFLIDMFSEGHWLENNLALKPDLFTHPWQAWQLLTYGFLHDSRNLEHIAFNMIALWIFGRDVEQVYGRKEFLRVYISLVITTGLAWVVLQRVFEPGSRAPAIGASGAIMGVMAIYICHYPNRQFLFWFVIPMPAWVLGVLYVGMDFYGVLQNTDHVAHTAHLAGVAFGAIYYKTGWSLASIVPRKLPASWTGRITRAGSKLRVHRDEPEQDENPYRPPVDMKRRVDELLEKISREGESSLTEEERRELEEASRRLRGRH